MSKISILDLPRHLRAEGIITTYNATWRAAVEGRIPAERHGSRWYVREADLPKIKAAFTPAQG
jgi:hypothetical protein